MQLKHCLAPSATFPLMKWSSLNNVIHRRLQRRRRRRSRQEGLLRHRRRRNRRLQRRRRRRRCRHRRQEGLVITVTVGSTTLEPYHQESQTCLWPPYDPTAWPGCKKVIDANGEDINTTRLVLNRERCGPTPEFFIVMPGDIFQHKDDFSSEDIDVPYISELDCFISSSEGTDVRVTSTWLRL